MSFSDHLTLEQPDAHAEPDHAAEEQAIDRQDRMHPGEERAEQQCQAHVAEAELAGGGEPQDEEQHEGGDAAEEPAATDGNDDGVGADDDVSPQEGSILNSIAVRFG